MKQTLLALMVLVLSTAFAQPSGNTLDVAFERTMLTYDTYATSERLALILAHNWGDTLIHRNPKTGEFEPLLATSWEFVTPTILELNLRTDVTFHNGEAFGPDDVKATFEYVTSEGAELAGGQTLQWIESVEVIDDDTVQIHAKTVTPTALETLALVGIIYPAEYLAEQGPDAMGNAPVGTGPYKFVEAKNNEARFIANENYFGGAKGQPAIPTLVIHTLPEESSRIAGLLTGEIDIARGGSISPDQAVSIQGRARVEAADILRVWFLQMDALGESGVDYFANPLVRQAVAHAINRQEIVDVLLGGYGTVIDTPCNPVQFGCDPGAAVTYAYDPELSKTLLAEAGYAEGFTVDLFGYRDQQVAQAIQGYLAAVGITTDLQWFGGQYDVVSQRQAAKETPLFFGSWGSSSIYDTSSIMDIFFTSDGTYSFTNSESIDSALTSALETVDSAEREQLYSEAIQEVTEAAYWVPLYAGRVLAGVSNDLNWTPDSDEIERYYTATWR